MSSISGKILRVFVYGTLLEGERNAYWAGSAKRTPATALGTIYDTGFGFPAFVEHGGREIAGEVLDVDGEGLARMDVLEGYPRLYTRRTITVRTADGPVDAWVYIMNILPAKVKEIECGDWRSYRRTLNNGKEA